MELILKPCLVVLAGLPLSGKSFLADRLVKQTNLSHIDVDSIRNVLDESRKLNGEIKMLNPEKEFEIMVKSYEEMFKYAHELIALRPVLLTGTFSRPEFKQPLKILINNLEQKFIPYKIFHLSISDEEALSRIIQRQKEASLSNIDSPEKYLWAKGRFEKIDFAEIIELNSCNHNCVEILIESIKGLG